MLAQVVLVKEMLLHSICARIEQHCMQIHKSDFFHHYGVRLPHPFTMRKDHG